MFKCHFDAGFIDTQADVVHKYFNEYFPRAIQIAAAQRACGQPRTSGPPARGCSTSTWNRPPAEDRKRMEQAIAHGDIAWHALPFTWQTEMLDPSMIDGSLALSQSLDRRFGRSTTGAKMTDVPGPHPRHHCAARGTRRQVPRYRRAMSACTPAELPPSFSGRILGRLLP